MEKKLTGVTLDDVLKFLDIEEFKEEIFRSNSHGELFHLQQYFALYEALSEENVPYFSLWFKAIVEIAKEKWDRPQSVYQHISQLYLEHLNDLENEEKKS